MAVLSNEERALLKEMYGAETALGSNADSNANQEIAALIIKLLKSSRRSEKLLSRALWEFGVELRQDIEKHLGENPLISS